MNNSEDFRRQCEARHILKMEHQRRQAFYQGIQDHRGKKAVDELIAEVKKQRRLQSEKTVEL